MCRVACGVAAYCGAGRWRWEHLRSSTVTMDSSRLLLLLLFVYLLTYSGFRPGFNSADQDKAAKKYTAHRAQELARAEKYAVNTDFSKLDLMNLESPKNPSKVLPFLPQSLEKKTLKVWDSKPKVYYSNISSATIGSFIVDTSAQLRPRKLRLPSPFENATSELPSLALPPQGRASLSILLDSSKLESARLASCVLNFDNQAEFELSGVYLGLGKLILATESLKLSDLVSPFLIPRNEPDLFEVADKARLLMVKTKNDSLQMDPVEAYDQLKKAIDRAERCEFVLYGHVRPEDNGYTQNELDQLEEELENPQGRPLKPPPDVLVDAELYSPDCGLSISLDTRGERSELVDAQWHHFIVFAALIYLGITFMTAKQFERCTTPSQAHRLSFFTFGLMGFVDSLTCFLSLVGNFNSNLLLPRMALTSVVFAFATRFELRLLVLIWQSQLRTTDDTEPMSESQLFSAVYTRIYLGIIAACLVLPYLSSLNDGARQLTEGALLVLLYSFWCPQIYRNAQLGSKGILTPSYIACISLLRLFPVFYFFFYKHNVAHHRYAPQLGWTLVIWQATQVVFLLAQRLFGGNFFLPASFTVVVHDYHPLISQDLEDTLHIEEPPVVPGEHPNDECDTPDRAGVRKVSCAVCMNVVELIVADENSCQFTLAAATLFARRRYMVTPCKHVFHTRCLEEWMRSRLQCPVCRNGLPPT